ncbi:MAG TPA: alpha-amylase family protein [Planctomycetota bacterium]|nr:alpha-amylase family protein [Planctomycetota bacterium]
MTRARAISLTGLVLAAFLSLSGAAGAADNAAPLNKTMAEFDQVRSLAMRALMQAQDLKCVCLYGRGFGLDMPESVPEDMLVEGLWVIDYLHSMDLTSVSLVSYAAAAEHPNLEQELNAFRAFLPEAAAMTLAYEQKTSKALAAAIAKVNAAAAEKAAFNVQAIPAQPWGASSAEILAGDGFSIGWIWPLVPPDDSNVSRYFRQHGYPPDRVFQLAAEAGVDFMGPEDPNLFDWADVEKQEGACDWSRIDRLIELFKRHDMPLWLPIPSNQTSPPEWLVQKLGIARAALTAADGTPLKVNSEFGNGFTGITDLRRQNTPINLFDAEVSAAFANYVKAVVGRVKAGGVAIKAVQLGGRYGLPYYSGPEAQGRFTEWLLKRYQGQIAEAEIAKTIIPVKLDTAGVADPAQKRLLLDVIRWREDEYIDYFRVQVEAVRAVDPAIPVCTASCEAGEANESATGRQNERLIQALGLVPFHFSTGENIWDDLRAAYSPLHFSACMSHTGSGNAFAQYSFSSYIHDTLTVMSWPTPIARGFYWADSYTYPDMRWRWSSLGSWHRFHTRAQAMAPEMLNTKPASQAAVLWSDTSHKLQLFIPEYVGGTYGFSPGPANYHKIGCVGWDRILNSLDIQYDFVTEDQVRAGRLGQYKMLIMPSVQALPADVAGGIRQFVQNGGLALATSAPALYGDDMEQKGAGQLADVFGADFAAFIARTPVADSPMTDPGLQACMFERWNPNNAKKDTKSDTLRTLFCTFKPREAAQVLEQFTTGEPAVVLNTFGNGKAVAIGYPIGRESFMSDIYHEHYGHNWADWPAGSPFQQGLFRWIELLLPRLGFERDAVVVEELVPRAIGQDAGWPCWQFPRKGGGYRDYVWKAARMPGSTVDTQYGEAEPRSVEVGFRKRDGNPNLYMTLFNREGAYGFDPGVIHFESTSKEIKLEMPRTDILRIYDLSLGCAVPAAVEKRRDGQKEVLTFRTMIEPSMARMLVMSTDDQIRMYSGNRRHGGQTDAQLRQALARLAGSTKAPDLIMIGGKDIAAFLAERGPKGMAISCESPEHLPAAKLLAAALEKRFGVAARITRNSPRIWGNHTGLGVWRSERYTTVEEPDILLGNRDTSHYIASLAISPGRGHAARLPIMASAAFPGPGRCAVALLRPYTKRDSNASETPDRLFVENPAPVKLVIGASDVGGLSAGVAEVVKLIGKAK